MSDNNNSNNKNNQMMQPNQRTMWFSIAGVVLLVALIIITPKLRNTPAAPAEPLQLDTPAEVVAGKQSSPLNSLSYADALKKYETSRIVLDEACKATPKTQTVAVGTTIMFDNQSATVHSLKVGEKLYQVGAYKYRTPTLDTAGTIVVDCDETAAIATITVNAPKAE